MEKVIQQHDILHLYSRNVSFIDVHHYICQLLTGAEAVLQDVEQWDYQLPFHIENCRMVLTGISQAEANRKYGWSQNDQLNCFAYSFRPSVKKILEKGGYTGDSYIFLYDREKYFLTLFSENVKNVKRTPDEIAAQIHMALQEIYENDFLKEKKEKQNCTILSAEITSNQELADSYAMLREQKKQCYYFMGRGETLTQDWFKLNVKPFLHVNYDKIKTKYRTDLLKNQTEFLHDYLHALFYDFVIPACDFFEMEELMRFLGGTMKMFIIVHRSNVSVNDRDFDYKRFENAEECYRSTDQLLAKVLASAQNPNIYSDAVVKTLDYIKVHYSEQIGVEEIARDVHFSPTYLSHIVARETGTTIHQYLEEYRMTIAKKLLKETNLNVNEIANSVGYNTGKYFSLKFRQHTGLTPLKYRKHDVQNEDD